MVCGMSQAVNDWFDRHGDAVNEPSRLIPSGRVPGRWGLWIARSGGIRRRPRYSGAAPEEPPSSGPLSPRP